MTEPDNPFESPRLLLAGAARHIAAFQARVDELRAGEWGTPKLGAADEFAGQVSITFKPSLTIPADLKQIAFDVTNNLRSALDHAVYAGTVLLTGEGKDGTKFPLGDDADEARRDAKRRCRHVPQELVDFLLTLEVHKAGNPVLWGLNKLRNTKSHRMLVPVGAMVGLTGMGEPSPGASVTYEWDGATGHFQPRMELAPDTEAGAVVFNFRLEILIGTGAFRGEPALGVFDRMASEVERLVSAIEAETARLLEERGN